MKAKIIKPVLGVLALGLALFTWISHTQTTPPANFELKFESEWGSITAPFVTTKQPNGAAGIQQNTEAMAPADGGKATYVFAVLTKGSYTLSMSVEAPDDTHNSLYVDVDVEPTADKAWEIPPTTGIEARTVGWASDAGAAHSFILAPGAHTLYIRGREPGVFIDKIAYTPVALAPEPPGGTQPPSQQPPTPPTGLKIN